MRPRLLSAALTAALLLPVLLIASGGDPRDVVAELRRVLDGALVAHASTVSKPVDFAGNVNGIVEQPLIEQLEQCLGAELAALSALDPLADGAKAEGPGAELALLRVNDAISCLQTLEAELANASGLQATSNGRVALSQLRKARTKDEKARKKLEKGRRVRSVRNLLDRALDHKALAKLALQGILARRADVETYTQPGVRSDAYVVTFEGRAERRFSVNLGWTLEGDGVKARVRREPGVDNRYLGVGARGDMGSAQLGLGREVWAPVEVNIRAGVFADPGRVLDDIDTAVGCLEADVSGATPRMFLGLCGRYTVTPRGYEAFTVTPEGSSTPIFLPDVLRADLRLEVSTGGVTALAAPAGTSPVTFEFVGGLPVTPQVDTWAIGLSVQGLGGKAEIGFDDLVVTFFGTTTTTTVPSGPTTTMIGASTTTSSTTTSTVPAGLTVVGGYTHPTPGMPPSTLCGKISGGPPNTAVTLQTTGPGHDQPGTALLDSNGMATFQRSISSFGTYTITVTAGMEVATDMVEVDSPQSTCPS